MDFPYNKFKAHTIWLLHAPINQLSSHWVFQIWRMVYLASETCMVGRGGKNPPSERTEQLGSSHRRCGDITTVHWEHMLEIISILQTGRVWAWMPTEGPAQTGTVLSVLDFLSYLNLTTQPLWGCHYHPYYTESSMSGKNWPKVTCKYLLDWQNVNFCFCFQSSSHFSSIQLLMQHTTYNSRHQTTRELFLTPSPKLQTRLSCLNIPRLQCPLWHWLSTA